MSSSKKKGRTTLVGEAGTPRHGVIGRQADCSRFPALTLGLCPVQDSQPRSVSTGNNFVFNPTNEGSCLQELPVGPLTRFHAGSRVRRIVRRGPGARPQRGLLRPFSCPLPRRDGRTHGWLFAVADGVGGEERGEVASQTAVETLVAGFRAAPRGEAHTVLMPRLVQTANTPHL